MPDLFIKFDDNFSDELEALTRALPEIAAKSLTFTAKKCQGSIQKDIPKKFKMRRPWVQKGIRIKGATVSKQWAEVGSVDDFMVEQEGGGEKRRHKHDFAVPDPDGGSGQIRGKSKMGVAGPKKWPRALIGKKSKKPYFAMKTRGNALLIAQRLGKTWVPQGNRKPKRLKGRIWKRNWDKVDIVYAIKKGIHLPPRWKFFAVVIAAVEEHWRPEVFKLLAEQKIKMGAK